MATELYKEEDGWVYNIEVWKLLLNSIIFIMYRNLHYPRMDGSEALVLFRESSFP